MFEVEYKAVTKLLDALPQDNQSISDTEYLGWGRDSNVYRIRDKVLKAYIGDDERPPLPYNTLVLYSEITNAASLYAEANNLQITLKDCQTPFPIRINPTESIEWMEEYEVGIATAKYIPGPSAREVFRTREIKLQSNKLFGDTYKWTEYPETDPIRKFLISQGVRQAHRIDEDFYKFDNLLNRKFGVKGIFVGLSNTKVLFDEESKSLQFIVTDLCNTVADLRRV